MLSSLNLGNLYRIQKKFNQAEIKLNQALDLTRTLKAKKEEGFTLQRLGWLAEDRQDYEKALRYQMRYIAINDSIIGEVVKKEANLLRESFEAEKKENEIILLSKQKLYQQFLLAILTLGLLILLIMVQWLVTKHKLTIKQKEEQEFKKKHLKSLIDSKDKELTAQAEQLIQMQKQLEITKSKISKIIHKSSFEKIELNKIDAVFSKGSLSNIKNDFDLKLTNDNQAFFKVLINKYPDLSPVELKLCAYLRLNLPTKDLAAILNRSVRTIESSRTNIRKKLNLDPKESLISHLLSIEEE
jgi:DNA-binding CsgD family transcriptional regulator